MKLFCGPEFDIRLFDFNLPEYPNLKGHTETIFNKLNHITKNYKIGILVSGGLDSALLYYLLLKENFDIGSKFSITPYTILRKEGSRHYAIKTINHIHQHFNLPVIELNCVGDNTLPEIQQVESGVDAALKENDFVYVGIIEAREEHSEGWTRYKFKETFRRKYPLLNLQKSHIVDLIYKSGIESVIPYTHSCAINELVPCEKCNGCKERTWGFDQIKIVDCFY